MEQLIKFIPVWMTSKVRQIKINQIRESFGTVALVAVLAAEAGVKRVFSAQAELWQPEI